MNETGVRWLVQNVASGVEHLHQQRITHRDLKPENIVLYRTGNGERDVVSNFFNYNSSSFHFITGNVVHLGYRWPEVNYCDFN